MRVILSFQIANLIKNFEISTPGDKKQEKIKEGVALFSPIGNIIEVVLIHAQ